MVNPTNNGARSLPEAKRERWQPMRGGLLNIDRFDHQEFRYEDGRLLLRGNNGTGKSRVLALQLPFILDGEIIPQRVEPDGDPAKRMEWNLLLGGKHDDRLGYTWLEFGRINEPGQTFYKTLGCALRAVQGRGIVQQWFFITSQPIGQDLFLENELGQALFKLGDRYGTLLNLLIQFRQPQLSSTLNEERLSDALSHVLPPLPDAVLGDVAEAFRSLEADRQESNDFIPARDSAELFLKDYRRYIQIAARRRAEGVRKAQSSYETTMRRLREAERVFDESVRELTRWLEKIDHLEIDRQRAESAEKTLRDSPELKDAKTLEEARLHAEARKFDSLGAGRELERAETPLARDKQQRQWAGERVGATSAEAQTIADRVTGQAQATGLQDRHRTAWERVRLAENDTARVDAAAGWLRDVVKRRLERARHIEKLNSKVEAARQQLAVAQASFAQAEGQLNESIECERGAGPSLENEIRELFDASVAWVERGR